jgi:ribosomal protein S18 acetylase RimI-like enzyme
MAGPGTSTRDREVRAISAEETRLLRHKVLRPHQAPEELVYPGDTERDSLHVGAFVGGALVGVASVVRRPMAGESAESAEGAWQLRGMATLPGFRGRGLGAAMLRACIGHVARSGGSTIWCNARTPAVDFYRKLGFETRGSEFEIPVSGPHFVMLRAVSAEDR